MRHRIVIVPTICVLFAGCATRVAPGSYPADDWRRVTSLSAGTDVRLWRVNPATVGRPKPEYIGVQPDWNIIRDDGRVTEVESSAISIQGAEGRLRIPSADVRRIDVITRGPDSVQNGFLAGTLIGGVPGLYLWAGSAKTSDPFGPAPFFLGALVGASIGTLADFARDGPRVITIYVARR